jgi:hypothetical protein
MRSAAHPSTALRLIAGVAVVLLGVTVSVNAAGTIAALTLAAAAYALILVEVARAARDRRHGTALGATALVVGVLAALLFPLTWGASAFPAMVALPLSVPGLRTAGLGRLLAALALLINAALTVLLVLIWFV